MDYLKSKKICLKNKPEITEAWLQETIIGDPEILGLGENPKVLNKEKRQPSGRLDLLLEDSEENRFCVELQLGEINPDHIIRAIDYWNIEQKRFPEVSYYPVLIAEEVIGSRYWPVLELLNRHDIPLTVIQIDVRETQHGFTLNFIKVLEYQPGLSESLENNPINYDQNYWEKRSTPEMLSLVHELKNILTSFYPDISLKLNKVYIGIKRGYRVDNFIVFKPQKTRLKVCFNRNTALDEMINNSEHKKNFKEITNEWTEFYIYSKEDLEQKAQIIEQIFKFSGDFKENEEEKNHPISTLREENKPTG